ncbi:hypothetical protein [Actinacidiphila rubida]|uniref:Uncharacterized protein n=1 Tax=Actinacidiphila rubida TaxID=310780 RepID=A0A1H8V2B8_9ACTN|nr:hypothetical protein [Actinacidiphila rubida]SEP09377.1 hypothetical protein SAMN05216267_10994 [Actinacidiphila rubida]
MDIVYATLRRSPTVTETHGEVGEVTAILWAHATSDDGLEHVSGRCEADRLDLLLYFLSFTPGRPQAPARAGALLARCYQASPAMRRRYLAPGDKSGLTPGSGGTTV